MRNNNQYQRKFWKIRKYYESFCQQIGQPRGNEQVSRNVQPYKVSYEKKIIWRAWSLEVK